MPNAWKLNSKMVFAPSQIVECLDEVTIRHGRSGSTSIAKRKLKFTNQWHAWEAVYFQNAGRLPL
jgi:hypothetical protein